MMTGDGRTFRRAPEVGEWYASSGQARGVPSLGDNCYRLLDGVLQSSEVPVYDVPEPEPEPEPQIDLAEFMRQQSGETGLKWEDSPSGIAQKQAAEGMELAGGAAGGSTAEVVNAALASGWWACEVGGAIKEMWGVGRGGTNGHDNGCPNTRSVQEEVLKLVNPKAGEVILEVGFFLGEALGKAARTLAREAKDCDLLAHAEERIEAAKSAVAVCTEALERAKEVAAEAAEVAAEAGKLAAEEKVRKDEEERAKAEARRKRAEEAGPMEFLKIIAEEEALAAAEAEAEAAAQGGPTLAAIASEKASASAAAGEAASAAAAALHAAAEEMDRVCIGGGGAGRVHGCELDADAASSLTEYLSEVLPADAADAVECCAADVGRGQNSLPFPDQCFDKIFCINALHFWPSLPSALAELRRVLSPAGELVVALQCSLIAAGQQAGHLPAGMPWSERDVRQAMREACVLS